MSYASQKNTSWFARLNSAFRGNRRGSEPCRKRRGLKFEPLETRNLLSATVLPTISGTVYEDPTGGGVISNDLPLSNVTVNLWRDGGDGVFEGKAPGSDDTLVGTTTSGANGNYQFPNLTAGAYFVQQDPVPGLQISTAQSVQTVIVTNSDLQGMMGTMIDSFSATSQYVSGSYHGGKTGTSSEAAPEAIGGNRNLYVQLTSTGGAVSLGVNSDFPGLLDYASNAASSGTYLVNWDGSNGNPAVLNPSGLGGLDITSQGANTGIELNASNDRANGTLELKVYSDANDWSYATVPLTNTTDGSLNSGDSQFVAFSSFKVGAGGGANFSRVGAIQLAINGPNTSDGQVGPVEAFGPMVLTENFVNEVQTDLSVVKTAAPSPVIAGDQLTYTFDTTNNGPSGATGVVLSDTLPSGVQYVSSSSSQGTVTNNGGTISIQLGSLGAGGSAMSTVVVSVNPGDMGNISNTATVTGNQPDPNPSNNISTVTTPVVQAADLAIVKTASPNPVKAGNQLTYTLTATDNGPSNATGVTIVDTLPAGTTYVSSSGQGSPSISGQTLTLNVGNLAEGASATSTVIVKVASSASGSITNTAVVSGNQPDPNMTNNTASVTTQIDVPVIQQATSDLGIVKTALPNPVAVGSQLTYTLVVTNYSLQTTATGVTIVDTLPVGFTYVSASGDNSVSLVGNTLTLTLPNLAAQASETVTLAGNVTAAAATSITNTATVSGALPDGNPANNTSNVTTTVTRPIGVIPTKYNYLGR